MTVDNFSGTSDAALIAIYRTAAAEHGRSSSKGDYRSANPQVESLEAAYREIRRRGAESQRLLLQLLGDDDSSVRVWAGSHALEFSPELGEATLEDLAGGNSLAAFAAKMTLREWRQGRLKFP